MLHVVPYYEPVFVYGSPVRNIFTLCLALARADVEGSVYLSPEAIRRMQRQRIAISQPRISYCASVQKKMD